MSSSKPPEVYLNPILEATVKSEASPKPADTEFKLSSIASICDCGPGSASAWPEDENSLNTTLCGVAEDLVHQYNTLGMDVETIKEKLWAGFRRGAANGDACRVQNNVLFDVLDEISGNMS
jgi:hypothetical protein